MARKPWNQVNAIYQIYPRSFMDSNSDGVGDLRGAIERLDYFQGHKDALGIDAIWFSPIFTSPSSTDSLMWLQGPMLQRKPRMERWIWLP